MRNIDVTHKLPIRQYDWIKSSRGSSVYIKPNKKHLRQSPWAINVKRKLFLIEEFKKNSEKNG